MFASVPNPFSESITITYALPGSMPVRITVYDSRGAFVATLEAGEQRAGEYSLRWDGTDEHGHRVAPGMYLLQLTTPGIARATKVEVVR